MRRMCIIRTYLSLGVCETQKEKEPKVVVPELNQHNQSILTRKRPLTIGKMPPNGGTAEAEEIRLAEMLHTLYAINCDIITPRREKRREGDYAERKGEGAKVRQLATITVHSA